MSSTIKTVTVNKKIEEILKGILLRYGYETENLKGRVFSKLDQYTKIIGDDVVKIKKINFGDSNQIKGTCDGEVLKKSEILICYTDKMSSDGTLILKELKKNQKFRQHLKILIEFNDELVDLLSDYNCWLMNVEIEISKYRQKNCFLIENFECCIWDRKTNLPFVSEEQMKERLNQYC